MRTVGTMMVVALMTRAGIYMAESGIARYTTVISDEKDLTSYWHLEGDCRDVEDIAHGTPGGGKAIFGPGPGGGKAVVLADRRFVTMGPVPKLDLPVSTVELWFRPEFQSDVGYNPCIIAKRKSSPETRFSVHIMSDYSCLAVWNGRQVLTFESVGHPLRRGEWYYLVVTCGGENLAVYLDALPCRRTGEVGTFSFEKTGLPLHIGSSTTEGAEQFVGAIDEVAIYSRILSVGDIERHMDAMGAKERMTAEQVAAKVAKERQQREEAHKKRLAERLADPSLLARGEPRAYRGEHLSAISLPIGGIGTGSIQIDGTAARPVWQIFNNMSQASVPNSFFAVRTKSGDGKSQVRVLQTAPVGTLAGMKDLQFRGEYPFGWFDFEDSAVGARVSLETFNPLIPLDLRNSAIPCAVYSFTVENSGPGATEVSVLGAQQNTVGFNGRGEIKGRAFSGYGGNRNSAVHDKKATFLHMTADVPKDAPRPGDMVLAVTDEKASVWPCWDTPEKLAADLSDDGALSGPDNAGPSDPAETLDGALAVRFMLNPGEKRTTTFVLTWYFPGAPHGHEAWGGPGNMYENWWKDAMDVACDVVRRLDDLTARTRLYHDSLYASNLPYWLLDRISSQVVVIRSQTCFWTRDGYFGGWEGCCPSTGCCQGNCNHVWHYAQAHARLFPELGRLMREQEFRFQSPEGSIPHRQPSSHPAFDGQCGGILGAYREHLMSADGTWLARHWDNVRRAMDFTIATWDKDEDGVLSGPQWNTLDGNLGGSTSWLGTMYLAALAAAERMAALQGDAEVGRRYVRIREAGARKQDETLFNGRYYVQIPDPSPQQDYGTGCHIDQLLGQWWAHQLDLGRLYPPEHERTTLRSLFQHNFRTDFRGIRQVPRKFVADEDAGMQMITWPGDDRPARHMQYADEVMSGFEYSAAAEMVYAGLLKEGLAIVRAAAERYDGRRRTGLTGGLSASWGYSGNPFCDDECGKFYARPMSVWSMLTACQGYVHDGPANVIGFKPIWLPEDHRSFFTAAEGWGLFAQNRTTGLQTERIELRQGRLALKAMVFQLPPDAKGAKAVVQIGARSVSVKVLSTGDAIRIDLDAPVVIEAGGALDVEISW